MVAQPRTATVRRSSRQQQQQEQQASANNNNIVAAASKEEEEESDDDDDEPSGDACSECGVANQRVMVTCAACVQHFHLGCTTPALRRRPVLASSWQCAKCTQSAGKSTSARAQRSAKNTSEAIGNGDDVKTTQAAIKSEPVAVAAAVVAAADSGANGRTMRKRGVAAASARASAPVAVKTETSMSDGDAEPPKKSRRTAAAAAVKVESSGSAAAAVVAAKEAATKATASVKSAAAAKTKSKGKQPKSVAASIKVSAKPKHAAQSKPSGNNNSKKAPARASKAAKKKTFTIGSEDDDDADSGGDDDDDGDSDFKSDDASDFKSDDDDDDDDISVASDDEFVLSKKKLPTLKTPPKKKANSKSPAKGKSPAKKSPAKGKKRAAPQSTNGDASADNRNGASNGTGNDGDADSMDLSNQGEEEEEEVEEAYAGPRYYIEYAANNRAKCKQCEEKLMKDSLRIGVRVKHSIFGLTTYYKICLSTAAKEAQENVEAAESLGTVNSPAKAESQPEPEAAGVKEENTNDNKKPIDPIQGFSSLTKADQAIVRAHMTKIEDEGLLDERLAITEDHYNKKTRMPEKEPSPFLTVPLLPYQREALGWMTAQEKSEYKGGILADEMGMGKTIQAIAVILENIRQKDDEVPGHTTAGNGKGKGKASAKNKVNSPTFLRGGTLVVCPVVAVMQWKSEIERFVERNHLSIYIHHGPKRCTIPEKIASYDIVLTTYSIIENEVRKTLGWDKVPCKYCKKKYLPDKLILHNKYFCGPNAKKTLLQDKQRSNKPKRKKAAGEEDSGEDDEAFYPKKPASKAKPRGKKVKTIDESDDDDDPVVLKRSASKSPLHQINWTRIVLDEAHYIKDRRNNTARGVFELKSEYKWCLTGTPLQNRIGELFSLIRFLQIKSYAYYHCNNCECQLLDFHFPNGKCELCEHTAMQHYSFFNKKIVIPIQAYGYVAEGKIAMLRLQNEVLQHILLRRTKEGRADDICLPPKLVRIRKDHLDERENDFYEAIYTQSQAQFNTYVSSGTLLNNYAHIFDLLIRLRQAVDHPYLVIFSKSNPALQLPASSTSGINIRPVVEEKPLLSMQADGENDDGDQERACTICHEDMEDPVMAKCGDVFCRECVKEFIESLPMGAEATCPACSKLLTVDLEPKIPEVSDDENEEGGANRDNPKTAPKNHQRAVVDLSRYHKTSILHRISDVHAFQTSTKIEALMQELEIMRQRDPSGKAIIFSQFVNMLDIIQHRLQLGGVKCVKMSGNMSMDMRDRTIKAFREDSSVTAFLISLKAGGVALNLTIASHIFLMDPWWNPAAENQAIDRTHRLGQFKPIQATRFIIAGTVEERILKLQEKKRLIFEGTVGASVSAVCRLTTEDLRFLFSR